MVSASAKQQIARELLALRKLNGPLDAVKLTHARMLIKAFGGDDPEVALTRLINLASEHEGDREISAAMASFGWEVSAESSLGRLSEYSERHYVDPRTVRRWADEGIRKLTVLIVGTSPWIQPRARQILDIDENSILLALDLRVPPNLWMNAPELWVGATQVEVGIGTFASEPREFRSRTQLTEVGITTALPMELRLTWTGEKLPVYETVNRSTREVVIKSRLVIRTLSTSVRTWRSRESEVPVQNMLQ